MVIVKGDLKNGKKDLNLFFESALSFVVENVNIRN